MGPLRTPSVMLALLLALILPLQGFAAAWSCGAHHAGSVAVQHHCAGEPGKGQTGGEPQHHCGTCCAAAIALIPLPWTSPPAVHSEASRPSVGPPPQAAQDRLDRPPRPA